MGRRAVFSGDRAPQGILGGQGVFQRQTGKPLTFQVTVRRGSGYLQEVRSNQRRDWLPSRLSKPAARMVRAEHPFPLACKLLVAASRRRLSGRVARELSSPHVRCSRVVSPSLTIFAFPVRLFQVRSSSFFPLSGLLPIVTTHFRCLRVFPWTVYRISPVTRCCVRALASAKVLTRSRVPGGSLSSAKWSGTTGACDSQVSGNCR